MNSSSKLKEKIWEKDKYYKKIEGIVLTWDQPGMSTLKKLAVGRKKVLDIGCGEGSRLCKLKKNEPEIGAFGVDVSKTAIGKAKKKCKAKFFVSDAAKLKFESNFFDLVYSAYVLEHAENPDELIKESVRVLKKGGDLVLVAPNYGSPNRASPVFSGSRWRKLFYGVFEDASQLFTKSRSSLNWRSVKADEEIDNYEIDRDTVFEPYSLKLIKYLKFLGLTITYLDTCWREELPHAKLHQRFFRLFGEAKIYPFKYWGPQIVVHAKK